VEKLASLLAIALTSSLVMSRAFHPAGLAGRKNSFGLEVVVVAGAAVADGGVCVVVAAIVLLLSLRQYAWLVVSDEGEGKRRFSVCHKK
jgi:hypothetical protein